MMMGQIACIFAYRYIFIHYIYIFDSERAHSQHTENNRRSSTAAAAAKQFSSQGNIYFISFIVSGYAKTLAGLASVRDVQ